MESLAISMPPPVVAPLQPPWILAAIVFRSINAFECSTAIPAAEQPRLAMITFPRITGDALKIQIPPPRELASPLRVVKPSRTRSPMRSMLPTAGLFRRACAR